MTEHQYGHQIPLLILSDAPDQWTGLARITRDLASLMSGSLRFRVATLGLGGVGSRALPFQQYHMHRYPNGSYEYGELSLPQVWDDWAGDEPGVVLAIQDLSRMLWLSHPEYVADEGLRGWLDDARTRKFNLWGYLPIDHEGPGGRLSTFDRNVLVGYDRVLAYSPWAAKLCTDAGVDASWLPHGIQLEKWKPAESRPEKPRVGVVMTNQRRKDWGLAADVCRMLLAEVPDITFHWHTDTLLREWNITALIEDFGLTGRVDVTLPPQNDQQMADNYRKCSLTLHFGLGEGLGYPIFESLACGVPALHGAYGGGASLLHAFDLEHLLVAPIAWRYEGEHDCRRPVFSAQQWVSRALPIIQFPSSISIFEPAWLRSHVEHLDWQALGPRWRKWFLDGVPR